MKRVIAALLCGLMLLSALWACNNGGSGNGGDTTVVTTQEQTTKESSTTVKELPTTEAPAEIVKILKSDLSKYTIVFPAKASGTLKEEASKLQSGIQKAYNVSLKLATDSSEPSEFEILVGETNRDESAALAAELKYYDFGYRLMETKLVICGKSESGSVSAVDRFYLNNVLTVNKTEAFYSDDRDKTFSTGSYLYDNLQINGVDIANYTIVYPQADENFESQLAQKLQLAIVDACGIYIENRSDADLTASDDRYEILIGNTNRAGAQAATANTGAITVTDKKVFLCGENAGCNAVAVTDFIEGFEVKKTAKDTLNYQPESKTVPLFDADGTLTVMSFNVYVGSNVDAGLPSPALRKDSVIAAILDYLPDTVGVQEASPTWYTYLSEALSDYYTIVGFGRESTNIDFANGTAANNKGEATFVLFAKDKFDLVKTQTYWLSDTPETPGSMYTDMGQEYLRVVTWAELTRKSDGKTFVHFNTHLDFNAEIQKKEVVQIIKYMQDYIKNGIPVISTADYNMSYESNLVAFKYYEAMGLVNSMAVAKEVGSSASSFSPAIDYVLCSDTFEVTYSTFIGRTYYGQQPSDHYPIYSELRF